MARVLEDDSMFRFQSQFNLNVENNLRNLIYHDVLNLLSDPFLDNNQNLSFFSEFIFNSHYMFRRSGPGHMLLHTVQKQKVQGRISLSLVKVKAKFAQTEDPPLEKIDPLRSNPAPSPTVPLLHCPHGPSMPRFFSSSADTSPPPMTRAGQAPRTWGAWQHSWC